jgi:hypothetical protein
LPTLNNIASIVRFNGIAFESGGGVVAVTVDSTLDMSTGMSAELTIENTNTVPIGIVVDTESTDFSITESQGEIVIPAEGSIDLTIQRETFGTFSGDLTIEDSSGTTSTVTISSSASGTFTTLADNLGATHIYDFAVGDTLSDKAGSLDISVVNASRYTLGAAAITGAVGQYQVTNTGAGAGLTIANADWHRDGTNRTFVWIGNVASAINTRATFMGPGSSQSTNGFFGLEANTNSWFVRGPTFNGEGWRSNESITATDGDMVVIGVWSQDPNNASDGYFKVFFAGNGGSVLYTETVIAAKGTTTDSTFYLGGDGSLYYTQDARWDHFSVYEKALSGDEINHILRLRGYSDIPTD